MQKHFFNVDPCANTVTGKVKDKAQNAVLLDQQTYDKLNKEVGSYKLVSVSVLVDRLKVNGSLARKAIRDLESKGVIRKVERHGSQQIYSKFFFSKFFYSFNTVY